MKVRAAGLLDLARIEEMHHTSELKVSAAAPPAARLWSVLSSTLSALLPLSQETLMYVAEERGKVVGFIQASGQPMSLDLRRARRRLHRPLQHAVKYMVLREHTLCKSVWRARITAVRRL